jgi:hypothetical protein
MKQKKLTAWLTIYLASILFACNNNTEKTGEPEKTTDTTSATAAIPAPAAFTPFDIVEISHTVKDFAKWKPLFDDDSTARKASGMDFIVIGRNNSNPNSLMIALTASDVGKAKAFAADPKLKDIMEKGGVVSKPDINYFHVLRFDPDANEKQWVLLTHKVKDFDAWLKVFDAEGTATRASFGLRDVVLSRAIDDPNTVHIVFDITDMAKAKARLSDPALKKIMSDAGVTGTPKVEFYTTAE